MRILKEATTKKEYPKVGTKLYIENVWTGSKLPYTVDHIEGGSVYVREAKLIFNGERYYDTMPDKIVDNPNGELIKLVWSNKDSEWRPVGSGRDYSVTFGSWEYEPYLN